jgi:hypothetical protein
MINVEINELDERYRPVVKRMVDDGILDTNQLGQIYVSEDMLEIFIILGRLGLV